MKRAKAKHEEPLKLDLDFNSALERLAKTDPLEVDRAIAEAEGRVRLVGDEDTGAKFLVYGTERGIRVDLRYEGETFWATEAQMSAMFGVTRQNINLHLQNIYKEGELDRGATCKESLRVGQEGSRQVSRPVQIYDLNAMVSVGYRVGSKEGTMFRIWATDKLVQILTKGFYVDVERLKSPNQTYDRVAELRDIVRDIRADEANTYREVRQLCTMCRDYNGTLRAYEVKRGNGKFDAGKIRSILRDLVCTHVLLKSYGAVRGYAAAVAEAKIIFYYGLRSIAAPLSLVKEDLDEHFQFPVVDAIEEVNAYFRDRLHALLDAG